MIVVVIIGILAAIAIPNMQHLIKRSKEASVRSNTHAIQVAVVPWNADPTKPGEISTTNLPGGGYMLKGRGQAAILTPFIIMGD